uniref:Uncharacterized protein n=1 Tax=Romanomermis culicivorax TaxID=13658 RepID=A0A915IIP1_ROMCU
GGGTPLLNAKRTAPRISGQFLGHNKDDLNEIFGVETSKQRNLNETSKKI